MPGPTRWAGISPEDRRSERRSLLVNAAFKLFGEGGEAAVSVRSVCRESELNSRYFYEASMTPTNSSVPCTTRSPPNWRLA